MEGGRKGREGGWEATEWRDAKGVKMQERERYTDLIKLDEFLGELATRILPVILYHLREHVVSLRRFRLVNECEEDA